MPRIPFRLLFLAASAAAAYVWYRSSQTEPVRPPRSPEPPPEPTPWPEPTPRPVTPDEPEPEPEPVPDVIDAEVDEPEAEAEPEPAPDPDLSAEPVEVNGLTVADPDAVLGFVNTADEDALIAAGITPAARATLLSLRPFGSLQSLADTRGIGPKTLQALVAAR